MAGAVGDGAGALHRRAFAEIHHVAAKGPLIDLAFLGAREGHAEMLEFVDRGRRVAAQIFDRVLIAQPVGALDRVIHVPAPVVGAHIAERRRDAALCRNRVRASGKYLGDAGGPETRLRGAKRGSEARAAGADDKHIETVVGDRIGALAYGEGLGRSCCVGGGRGHALRLRSSRRESRRERQRPIGR